MIFIAVQRLSWISPFSSAGWIGLAACCAMTWLVLRLFWGKSVTGVRLGLHLLRGLAVVVALLIILGPTIVDEESRCRVTSNAVLSVRWFTKYATWG